MTFDWDQLHLYRACQTPWPVGYPPDHRTLFSPVDPGVHQLLIDLLAAAQHSIIANHFGYDDDDVDQMIRRKMLDPHVYVQLSLDSTQAAGVHEKAILAKWPPEAFGTSLAVGQSVKHAISHLKVTIVDGLYVVSGSTNLSASGEGKQDNELMVMRNAVLAAQYRSILDINHAEMQRQMAARKAAT